MNRYIIAVTLVASVASAYATGIGENILLNGGFESDTAGVSDRTTFAAGATTAGWISSTEDAGGNNYDSITYLEKQSSALLGVPDYVVGTYAVAFHGGGAIQQTVMVDTPGYYRLSFRSTRRPKYYPAAHFYISVRVDGVDQGIHYKVTSGSEIRTESLPCFYLSAGTHTVGIYGDRHGHSQDCTLHLDEIRLELFGTGEVGREVMINGGFEEESSIANGKDGLFAGAEATSAGWSGAGGARLSSRTSSFGGVYAVISCDTDTLAWDYCATLQSDALLIGTISVPAYGLYRVAYRSRCRNQNSTQTLEVRLTNKDSETDIVLREEAPITGIEPTVSTYENVELFPGTYSLVFSTASVADHTWIVDDVSVVCTECFIEDVIYVSVPELKTHNVVYNFKDQRPTVPETEDYSVEFYPDGAWIAPSDAYEIRYHLRPGANRAWVGGGTAPRVHHFSISNNLLKNGGFELESNIVSGNYGANDGEHASTAYWQGGVLEKAGSPYLTNPLLLGDSTYAMALQGVSTVTQEVDIAETGYYRCSLKCNRREGSSKRHYLLVYLDGEELNLAFEVSGTNVFQFVSGIFPIAAGHHTFALGGGYGAGTWDSTINIDDVSLAIVSRGEIPPSGYELLSNGNFDLGFYINMSGTVGNLADENDARSAGWSGTAKLIRDNSAFGEAAFVYYQGCVVMQGPCTLSCSVDIPIKGRYRLSYWVKSRNGNQKQKLQVTLGEQAIFPETEVCFAEPTEQVFDDLLLLPGSYTLTFTTSLTGDKSLFLEGVSLTLQDSLFKPGFSLRLR